VLFLTYSTLTSGTKKRSRLEQIVSVRDMRLACELAAALTIPLWASKWCAGSDDAASFEGCIIFDEAHKAKHFATGKEGASTKVATCVVEMQAALPRARVVYCSATGVSDVANMGYMSRLGCAWHSLWNSSLLEFLVDADISPLLSSLGFRNRFRSVRRLHVLTFQ
jgi:hypothetical protein